MAHTIAIIIAKINDTSASGHVIIIPEINIFENDSKNNSILSLLKIFLLVYTLKQTLGQLNQSKRF